MWQHAGDEGKEKRRFYLTTGRTDGEIGEESESERIAAVREKETSAGGGRSKGELQGC